MGVCAFAET
uniref:Uncharacterized protein n=1 Tax=Anguilla anguilla TaxID=7936 RepID=A0A0E9RZM8_ANGAN